MAPANLKRLQAAFRETALGPLAALWAFAFVLIDASAAIVGRTSPGLMLLASLPTFVLGVSLSLVLNRARRGLRSRAAAIRWSSLVAGLLVATAIQSLFDLYWLRWLALHHLPSWQEWALDLGTQRLSTSAILYFWTFCLGVMLLWALRATGKEAVSTSRAATAEAAAAKATAAALRLQLNPHFLFNTLNSISSLVTLDRKQEAEAMIDRLADFLRASLNADPMEDVPLEQEIETVDAYLDIEATRFGERLTIHIDIAPGTEDALVPNFILQPLVENAIKHGVSAIRGAAELKISAVRDDGALVLTVFNTSPDAAERGEESSRPRTSTGIGLANSRQRLANRYEDKARLDTSTEKDGYRAVIRLPFHRH